MRRKLIYSWLAVLLSAVVTVFVTSAMSTHAQQPSLSHGKDCIMRIDPLKPGQTSSTHGQLRCFGSFRAAIYAATDGAVRLPAGDHILTQRENERAEATTSSTVLSVDYVDSNYGGLSLTWYASAGCGNGNSYAAGSMLSGWNDVVSSALTYANCNHNLHYEDNNYGFAVQRCQCATMKAMNDKTSSEKWDENGFTV